MHQLLDMGFAHIAMAELTGCPGILIDLKQFVDEKPSMKTKRTKAMLAWLAKVGTRSRRQVRCWVCVEFRDMT